MEERMNEDEKSMVFADEAKLGLHEMLLVLLISSMTVLGLIVFWGSVGENVQKNQSYAGDAFWGSLLLVALVGFVVFFLLGWLPDSKRQAVKQCIAVAEKIGLELSPLQWTELESKLTAGTVLLEFVAILEEKRPELIRDGAFLTGVSKNACRAVVADIWDNYIPAQVESNPSKPRRFINFLTRAF